MSNRESSGRVKEPAKTRPVLYDVDVVIAGAGVCGTFAAIAAGRCGARTLVIERFGQLGGNIGPGMIVAGTLYDSANKVLPFGLKGIPEEFMERLAKLRVGPRNKHIEESNITSYIAYTMMQEAGVEILFCAYASDPIMKRNRVAGLFVETRSGRGAIKTKVTVDATGDANVAMRAGAPIIPYLEFDEAYREYIRPLFLREEYPTYYNDTNLYFLIAGVNLRRFRAFARNKAALSKRDTIWPTRRDPAVNHYPPGMIRCLRKAVAAGEIRPDGELEPGVRFWTTKPKNFVEHGSGIVSLTIFCYGAIDSGDAKQVSRLEGLLRAEAAKIVKFYQRHVPGFKKAYLLAIAPFLGFRGGRHINGEHTLAIQEPHRHIKCRDVLFRYGPPEGARRRVPGFEVPYGIALPKKVHGLLVCGRGAAYLRRGHDPSLMRSRPVMMTLGQAVGTAAAVAAHDGVTPKKLDISKVQRKLLADGIFIGDEDRLKELGFR